MRVYRSSSVRRGKGLIGNLVNKAIDILPVELHIPGYQYCGPGTNLSKRLQRGDPGINKLDEACKAHDIAYSKYSDSEHRTRADRELSKLAWRRVKASDSSIGERAAALTVAGIMRAKAGSGIKKRKNKKNKCLKRCCKKGKGLYLKPYKKVGSGIKKKKKTRRK